MSCYSAHRLRASRRMLTRAVVETIEPRLLLAAFVLKSHGVLEVTASDGANAIHASFAAGKVTIDVDGVSRTVKRSHAKRVIIKALGGNDTILIDDSVNYTIDAGAGDDTVTGGAGDDCIIAGKGDDVLDGREGHDTIDYTGRSQSLDAKYGSGGTVKIGSEIDTLTADTDIAILGGCGADNFAINTAVNTHVIADAGRGDDTLSAAGIQETGTITLRGGAGNDTLSTGTELGADNFFPFGDAGDDLCYVRVMLPFVGGRGNDTFSAEKSANIFSIDLRLMPTTENATLNPLMGGTIIGNDLPNVLSAGVMPQASVNLQGLGGDDILIGSTFSDTLIGGDGSDTVDYSTRTQNLTLTLDGIANDGAAGENDAIAGDIENVIAGSGNDTIVGNDQRNRLDGGAGNDHITGGGGRDRLVGGDGDDTATADALDRLIGFEHLL